MTTRQITAVMLVTVVAIIAVVAIVKPELGEGTIATIHVVALALGAIDVLLVAISILAEGGGH